MASAIRNPTPTVRLAPVVTACCRFGTYWLCSVDSMTFASPPNCLDACSVPAQARSLNPLSPRPAWSVTMYQSFLLPLLPLALWELLPPLLQATRRSDTATTVATALHADFSSPLRRICPPYRDAPTERPDVRRSACPLVPQVLLHSDEPFAARRGQGVSPLAVRTR